MKSKFLATIIFVLMGIFASSANAYEVKLDLSQCKHVKLFEMGSYFATGWGIECPGEFHYVAIITDYQYTFVCVVQSAIQPLYKVVLHNPKNPCIDYSIYRLQEKFW